MLTFMIFDGSEFLQKNKKELCVAADGSKFILFGIVLMGYL